MIKAIIFDFFGVIVGDGFEATYRSAGGDPVKDKLFVQQLLDEVNRGNISTDDFRRRICEQLNITTEAYAQAITKAELVNHELLNYIKNLRRHYKTAILSNVNKGGIEKRIKREVLNEYFDDILVSGEVGYIKPEPEIYKLAAQRLEVDVADCVFIDDREPYVRAAIDVGMAAIYYKNFVEMRAELEKILAAVADN